jgi:calcium/calmodulin-dependent protein kinase I
MPIDLSHFSLQWLADSHPHFVPDPESPSGGPTDLLPYVKKAFDARGLCACRIARPFHSFDRRFIGRKAAFSIKALNRMATLANSHLSEDAKQLSNNVRLYQEESAKV